MKNAIAALLVSAATVHMAAAAPAAPVASTDPVVTTLQVRLEVAPDGRVVSATLPPRYGAALSDAVNAYLAGWRFQPPERDGAAVGGVTYLRVHACAASDGRGGIELSLRGHENGPGYPQELLEGRFVDGRFPSRLAREGRPLVVTLEYRVETDGRAIVEAIQTEGSRGHAVRELEDAIRRTVERLPFEPEMVDGSPAATRMQVPISYTFKRVESESDRRRNDRDALLAEPACQALLDDSSRQRPVALDSPFRASPTG